MDPPRLDEEVEKELIKYASLARPVPDGHAWRVVEVRTNTGGWASMKEQVQGSYVLNKDRKSNAAKRSKPIRGRPVDKR